MCNLYRMKNSAAEVASLFRAQNKAEGSNHSEYVFPGNQGLVVAKGIVVAMTWGFPLVLKSKRTGEPLKPKPVNNARTDKLDSFFWRDSFENRRCLIPVSSWAEAQGAKGAMTRTWMSLPETFACAAVWRDSNEWGRCYSMVMTDTAGDVAKVHDRMPVILNPDDYTRWQEAKPEEARKLCTAWTGKITIDRTDEPWVRR